MSVGSEAKKNFSLSQKPAKTTKIGQITCNSRHTPWGYPEGVPKAKNHLGLLFGSRLEALTRKSQNLGFQRVQYGCLAPSGAVKIAKKFADVLNAYCLYSLLRIKLKSRKLSSYNKLFSASKANPAHQAAYFSLR